MSVSTEVSASGDAGIVSADVAGETAGVASLATLFFATPREMAALRKISRPSEKGWLNFHIKLGLRDLLRCRFAV